jgi:hypothetical protein
MDQDNPGTSYELPSKNILQLFFYGWIHFGDLPGGGFQRRFVYDNDLFSLDNGCLGDTRVAR